MHTGRGHLSEPRPAAEHTIGRRGRHIRNLGCAGHAAIHVHRAVRCAGVRHHPVDLQLLVSFLHPTLGLLPVCTPPFICRLNTSRSFMRKCTLFQGIESPKSLHTCSMQVMSNSHHSLCRHSAGMPMHSAVLGIFSVPGPHRLLSPMSARCLNVPCCHAGTFWT